MEIRHLAIGLWLLGQIAWGITEPLKGSLDLRPSWTASQGTFHTENEAALLYAISPNVLLGYVQEFETNLYNRAEGLSLAAVDGYLKSEIDLGSDFTFEPRLILPTDPNEQLTGLHVALRPMIKWDMGLGSVVRVEWRESPIIPFYETAGYIDSDFAYANRAFENRFEIIPYAEWWEGKLQASVTFAWQWFVHREFADGAENNGLNHSEIWISPEVVYKLTNDTGIGLSYYTQNLLGDAFSTGFSDGVYQGVFQQSF